jgi:predicted  nucleic acid-binding Zn-ribbon protein
MSQVMDLLTLQGIDDEADAKRRHLADVEERLAGDEALEAARAELAEAEVEHTSVSREQRNLEAEVAALNAKIAPEEKRLYDGSVKNPKELSSIQHEIDLLKQRRGKFEERLLEVLARLEVAEARLAEARASVEREAARSREEHASLEQEAARLRQAIDALEARREAQRRQIVPGSLSLYDNLRKRRGNAIVRIQGQSCSGCRVAMPEVMRKRAMSPVQLAQCPNCERILYIG